MHCDVMKKQQHGVLCEQLLDLSCHSPLRRVPPELQLLLRLGAERLTLQILEKG